MAEHGLAFSPELMERYDLIQQGLSAEMIADHWEIPRSELDEFGLRSQQLAPPGDRRGPLRARDHPLRRSTATPT